MDIGWSEKLPMSTSCSGELTMHYYLLHKILHFPNFSAFEEDL